MERIFHITSNQAWGAALELGEYRASSLDGEGFIHCSTVEQVVKVANAFYHGQSDLVVLVIAPESLQSPLRFEAPIDPLTHQPEPNNQERFPHIYGPVNLDAVVQVVAFPPLPDGSFAMPV